MAEDFPERTTRSRTRDFLGRHGLTLATVTFGTAGLAIGQALRSIDPSDETLRLIQLPGHVVMHGYSMLLIPLMGCGITLGVSSLRQSGSTRLVSYTLIFFFTMMFVTSLTGCLVGRLLRLGHHTNFKLTNDDEPTTTTDSNYQVLVNAIVDFFENALPENIFLATAMQKKNVLKSSMEFNNGTENVTLPTRHVLENKLESNYIGLTVVFVIFGYTMGGLGSRVNTIVIFLEEVNSVIMKIMECFVRFLPVGLFFWLLCQGLSTDSLSDMFIRVGFYLTAFVVTQLLYQLLVLPVLYLLVVRKNPLPFHWRLMPAVCMAFGTASSSMTLPLSLRLTEDVLGIDQRVSRLVLPLGAIFNLQGSTLGNPLTVCFIAGMQGVDLGVVRMSILSVSNVLMQLAIPNLPGSGLSILWFLHFVGVHKPYVIGIVLTVMWLLERLCACSNVLGSCYVAAFVQRLCRTQLTKSDLQTLSLDLRFQESSSSSSCSGTVHQQLRDLTVSVY